MHGFDDTDRKCRYTAMAIVFGLVTVAVLAFVVGLTMGRSLPPESTSIAVVQASTSVHPESRTEVPTLSPGSDMSVPLTSNPPTISSPTNTPLPPAPTDTPPPPTEGPFPYGLSVQGNELLAFRLGTGPSVRALIGGIHGGYERNTTVLVSETLAHLKEQTELIPPGVTLYIIPCANPDGDEAGTDAINGRVNGNGVDLNRNWDYQWQMAATHGTRPVSAGKYAFSEPETAALRDFIFDHNIEAAIFYHSAMGKIFSGADREKSASFELAEMMSEVTGYPHAPEGVGGQITTGNAIDYLSTKGIAAIEVELTTHEDIDWDRNWPGVLAFLDWMITR
jgi:hypothetical protein